MPSGVRIKGLDKAISRFRDGELGIAHTLEVATRMSLNVIRANARLILSDYYATVPRRSYQAERTGALYRGFKAVVIKIGDTKAEGALVNDVPEALYLNDGTRDHFIAPVNVRALMWEGPDGPEFDQFGHTIAGIHAVHFMEDALYMSIPAIEEIYHQAFANPELAIKGKIAFSLISNIGDEEAFIEDEAGL